MTALPDLVPLRKAGAHPCLLLNADYRPLDLFPLSVWDWQKAIHAVVLDRVDVVAEHDSPVRSQHKAWKKPSVVALREYVGKRPHVAFDRQNILLRDRFCCAYDGQRWPSSKLTIDHVVPISRGGTNNWTNVVACCDTHNFAKADRTPREAGLTLLWRPWQPTPEELHRNRRIEKMYNGWEQYLVK